MELFALMSLALVAGVVSFSAPCSLPLLPGFVGYLSGLPGGGTGPDHGSRRSRTTPAALLFVLGFATVFTAMGATASALGAVLLRNLPMLDVLAGTFIVVMGLITMGLIQIPVLQRQWRLDLHRFGRGRTGALSLGAAFALGWTPCVGPVLASILATAAGSGTVTRGALLLFAYSVGLGVPFVLLAGWLGRGGERLGWLRRHSRRIEVLGGVVLVVMGVALITGQWTELMSRILASYARIGWPPI